MVSNISLQNKAPGLPGQQRKSGLEQQIHQVGPQQLIGPERECQKKKKNHTHTMTGVCQRDTGAHGKSSQWPKLKTIC